MISFIVHIWIMDDKIEEFKKETSKNRLLSIEEEGNVRFEFYADSNEKGKFILFEIWKNQNAILLHKQTKHYQEWSDKIKTMMLKNRMKKQYELISPQLE